MSPAVLADIIVFIHFLYLIFTVGGEAAILAGAVFRWKWIRNSPFRTIHLAASAFVAFEALSGMICPLTELEWKLREAAGQYVDRNMSFVAKLIHKIMFYDFPTVFFIFLYVFFATAVILSFIFIKPERKK
jgi:hypothetical protein